MESLNSLHYIELILNMHFVADQAGGIEEHTSAILHELK